MSHKKGNIDDEWLVNGAVIAFTIIGLVAGAAFFNKTGSILLTILGGGFGIYVGFRLGMVVGDILDLFFGQKTQTSSHQDQSSSSESGNSQGKSNSSGNTNKTHVYEQYFSLLESSPRDDFDTIKRNYRRLIIDFHPDHLGENASESKLKYANKMLQKINEAYKILEKLYAGN